MCSHVPPEIIVHAAASLMTLVGRVRCGRGGHKGQGRGFSKSQTLS